MVYGKHCILVTLFAFIITVTCLPSSVPEGSVPAGLPIGINNKPKRQTSFVASESIDMAEGSGNLRQRSHRRDSAEKLSGDIVRKPTDDIAAPPDNFFMKYFGPNSISVLLVILTAASFYQVKSASGNSFKGKRTRYD